ncbi:helix-turn-helix domain-containing protein [Streptomyces erythrochromogenes]|nr:helix-turn-helix domain-containing protein [Streptomyces erythrochromogenes]
MSPIPAGAPPELAALVNDVRTLMSRQLGLSFAEVSERTGLPKSTLAHALSGRRLPGRETFARIIDALVPPEMGHVKERYMRGWSEAEVAVERARRPVPAPPPAGDAGADLAVAEGGRVWLFDVKDRVAGAGRGERPRLRFWVLDVAEQQAALREVADAQNQLNLAMDRLEQATADVAAARAALREATHRASRSVPTDDDSTGRDAEAAIRIADDTRPER